MNEYQEEVDNLQKEYQDLTQKTGLDGIMEGRGGVNDWINRRYNEK